MATKNTITDGGVGDLVYTPADASVLTLQLIKNSAATAGIGVPLYISSMDADYFLPMRPGELITVIGRPSNYKSGLMQHIARHEAMKLAAEGRSDKEYVAYMTWEQAVEEMVLYELASFTSQSAADLLQGKINDEVSLKRAANARAVLPLWLFGHSLERRRRRPRMTMIDAEDSIKAVEDGWGQKPSLIVVDYLQRIAHHRPNADPRQNFIENIDRCKDLALAMGCPVIMGCQAKREVDNRNVKIPQMGDGAESSNVEHSSDGILTVFMPKTAYPEGDILPDGYGVDGGLAISSNILLVSVAKRKLGKAGRIFPLYVQPEINRIAPIELERINL